MYAISRTQSKTIHPKPTIANLTCKCKFNLGNTTLAYYAICY